LIDLRQNKVRMGGLCSTTTTGAGFGFGNEAGAVLFKTALA
jgi:hypothetical protein